MYRIITADRDTYITDRIIDSTRKTTSNVGLAGSLDLFKIYGLTFSGSIPNVELSRLLIHFDLSDLQDLYAENKIDINNSSFFAKLNLSAVHGGQTTPSDFDVDVYPLSASFREGIGQDVALYSDHDTANFLSGSNTPWFISGCFLGGGPTTSCDYITASQSGISFKSSQNFPIGTEDLSIDVTAIISSTLSNQIPDEGFRISFSTAEEEDQYSYFVKRFASRQAFDTLKHPRLIFGFDDSVQDDSQLLSTGTPATLFFYNSVAGNLSPVLSGTQQITGSNSVLLRLETEISGGFLTFYATGSEHKIGSVVYPGVYSASITVPSINQQLSLKFQQSSSVKLTPIWSSFDQSVSYFTGSQLQILKSTGNSTVVGARLVVTTTNVSCDISNDTQRLVRVNIFDPNSPLIIAKRLPITLPGKVIRDVYYSVRDIKTNTRIIPFDKIKKSTRVSSDSAGMFFNLDARNLFAERLYVIDILVSTNNGDELYENVSPEFRINAVA